jgi:hypothetical protein
MAAIVRPSAEILPAQEWVSLEDVTNIRTTFRIDGWGWPLEVGTVLESEHGEQLVIVE